MNIYKISCYSECGSYFQPYLKSLTIRAESSYEALLCARDYVSNPKNGEFIYPEEKWKITLLSSEPNYASVIDFEEDSDY